MSAITEWLSVHALDASTVHDCVAVIESGHLNLDLEELAPDGHEHTYAAYSSISIALSEVIIPAFTKGLRLSNAAVEKIISSIRWNDAPDDVPPHTIDNGVSQPPEISMSWSGGVADLICLAHEVAHAVQLYLSQGSFVPPVVRETCAFRGELALIEWASANDVNLAASLLQVWQKENRRYFGKDCNDLRTAVGDPEAAYSYRMNYPLARAAAVVLWRSGAETDRLFMAGADAMEVLPISAILGHFQKMQIDLPPLPLRDTDQPAVQAYRALGAITLLDIMAPKDASEHRIEDYYTVLLNHMQNQTAFIAVDGDSRPFGYATWRKATDDNAVSLIRQSAPFGNHKQLYQALARHLGPSGNVLANHLLSEQQQTALQ